MDWVLDYYKQGYYNANDLKLFVQVNWITADQYKKATGEDYVAPAA
ncbi:XkdX family protein [Schleiferilactobacillus harbinensis]|uniref:XkdX family protein n=1 Tax=Schleiferilactobacillus harbinensis TaxID=304207 RepID=A0A5P8M5A9_9LACO|nr:XkdX family protein [Schleiferilactobacillus harbinensis]QFR23690.1 XkdX family protein [Schleiferilactobacillus harbinensis]